MKEKELKWIWYGVKGMKRCIESRARGITLGKMQIGRMVKIFHFYIRFKSVLKYVYNIYGRNQVLVRGAAA